MQRYLILFSVPVDNGWKTVYRDAMCVVTGTDLPFGYCPDELGGYPVAEMKYIIALPDGQLPLVVSSEYDKEVPLVDDGIAILINDQTMGLTEPSPGDGDIDEIADETFRNVL